MFDTLNFWELEILHFFDGIATSASDIFWTLVTYFGEAGIFWIALSLFLMFPKKTRKIGFSMALALLLGVIVGNGILKNVFGRIRPYDLDPSLSPRLAWGEMTTDFSFPSGHTLASFEGATAIFMFCRKWGVAALVLATLTALSRIFLLVHYPSDVLAGAVLGIAFGVLSAFIVEKVSRKLDARV